MPSITHRVAALAAISCLAFTSSACQPNAANTAPAPVTTTADAGSSSAAVTVTTAPAASTSGQSDCDAFYASYQACIDHAHDPATAARLGRELHAMQESVAQAGNAASRERECGQFRTAFARRASEIGCS